MSKTVTVRWETTEVFEADIEVPDDWDPETDVIDDSDLSEYEGNDSGAYEFTSERTILEISDGG